MADAPFFCSVFTILYDSELLGYGEERLESPLEFANECTVDAVCSGKGGVRSCDEVGAVRGNDIEEVLLITALSARLGMGRAM